MKILPQADQFEDMIQPWIKNLGPGAHFVKKITPTQWEFIKIESQNSRLLASHEVPANGTAEKLTYSLKEGTSSSVENSVSLTVSTEIDIPFVGGTDVEISGSISLAKAISEEKTTSVEVAVQPGTKHDIYEATLVLSYWQIWWNTDLERITWGGSSNPFLVFSGATKSVITNI